MARSARDSRLETRTARSKLPTQHEPYWRAIGSGLHLGYRKGIRGGRWIARLLVDGKYVKQALGNADDYRDANGLDVLDYFQAQEKARAVADDHAQKQAGLPAGPYTVAEAMADYLDWYVANRRAPSRVRLAATAHILPLLGSRQVAELTTREIRQWHERLASTPARVRTRAGEPQQTRQAYDRRSRQATANRILTILKAALNSAWREGRVASDEAWRRVKPFRHVDAPKIRFLTEAECTRLINACQPDFRDLVLAALLTGCRYGELAALAVNDFNPAAGTIYIRDSKSGKPRHVPLTEEGRAFFARVCAGRRGGQVMFLRAEHSPWKKNHQSRPIQDACQRAGIDPPISFHVLRHTYGSMLALRGVPLQVIAAALGHADTRITERHYAHLMPSFVADTIRAHLPSFGVEKSTVAVLKHTLEQAV